MNGAVRLLEALTAACDASGATMDFDAGRRPIFRLSIEAAKAEPFLSRLLAELMGGPVGVEMR